MYVIGGVLLGFGLTRFGIYIARVTNSSKMIGAVFGLLTAIGIIIILELL